MNHYEEGINAMRKEVEGEKLSQFIRHWKKNDGGNLLRSIVIVDILFNQSLELLIHLKMQ